MVIEIVGLKNLFYLCHYNEVKHLLRCQFVDLLKLEGSLFYPRIDLNEFIDIPEVSQYNTARSVPEEEPGQIIAILSPTSPLNGTSVSRPRKEGAV